MTCETLEQQNSTSEMRGAGKKGPGKMEQMMRKMLTACGPMMAGMMEECSSGEGEHCHGGETGQQPQGRAESGTGCGCSPAIGECLKGGTSKTGEQA